VDEGGFTNNIIFVKETAIREIAITELELSESSPIFAADICPVSIVIPAEESPGDQVPEQSPGDTVIATAVAEAELVEPTLSDPIPSLDEIPQLSPIAEQSSNVLPVLSKETNPEPSTHSPEVALPISQQNATTEDAVPLAVGPEAVADPVQSALTPSLSDQSPGSAQDLQEVSIRQDAAILELQQSLDQARAHAKQLLSRVAELEKVRSCEETGGHRDPGQGGQVQDSLASAVKAALEVVHQVFASCLPSSAVQGSMRTEHKQQGCCVNGSVRGGGPGLSVARQFDNLWVRLRGGERSGQAAQAGQDEMDKTLKLAGAQAAQALSRIESLEASIALLTDGAGPSLSWEPSARS
jgi:hypothetical protein